MFHGSFLLCIQSNFKELESKKDVQKDILAKNEYLHI